MHTEAAVRHAGDVGIVDLSGRITAGEGCHLVYSTVKDLVGSGRKNVLLNLEAVTYVDSSALGEMARCYVTVSNLGGQLKLVNARNQVDHLLRVTRLFQLFVSFSDESDALRSFSAPQPS